LQPCVGQIPKDKQKVQYCSDTPDQEECFIAVWGAVTSDKVESKITGFGAEESFDAFLSMNEPPPVPKGTPARFNRQESGDSDDGPDFSIFIK
jgi:hypothetical protein